MRDGVQNLLKPFPEIGLYDLDAVRLMNRIDRKYLVSDNQLDELLSRISSNYMAQIVDGIKYLAYDTVYLDDMDHTMYMAHHNGRLVRQKVRVRTYLDSVHPSFFEVKLKNNHGRTKKKRFKVGGLDTLSADGAGVFLSDVASLPVPLEDMHPTLKVGFERITLVDLAMTERVTIDTGLTFHNLETGLSREMSNLVVVEVKRNSRSDSFISDTLKEMRVHPAGFSKYCMGSAYTNDGLKHNRFNVRMRMVDKLMNRI